MSYKQFNSWMKAIIKIQGFSFQSPSSFRFLSKLIFFIIIIISILTYIFHPSSSVKVTDFVRPSTSSNLTENVSNIITSPSSSNSNSNLPKISPTTSYCNKNGKTQLHHLVFAIASSAGIWKKRQNYVKLWWKPDKMKGFVWLDKPMENQTSHDKLSLLPTIKISSDTSEFKEQYNNQETAVRIARIVSETFRLGFNADDNVRWFVMGDDDTFFVDDNLLRVLRKYDHNQFYYIGGLSETHLHNFIFGYNMAFGGGGFAISYPLAKAFEGLQDRCMKRYKDLYTSDHRIQACMAEIGVPLTREVGFHQFDVQGSVFGILAAHPIAPLVTIHHLDLVQPIFPNSTQLESLKRLKKAINLDSASLAQQSICYDTSRNWTISVSWGFAVQILRGIVSARLMERPATTFGNWYNTKGQYDFSFNIRHVVNNGCQEPFIHMFYHGFYNSTTDETSTTYVKSSNSKDQCMWRTPNPDHIKEVHVFKKADPHQWSNKAPRRGCCRVLPSEEDNVVAVDVGGCRVGEIVGGNLA